MPDPPPHPATEADLKNYLLQCHPGPDDFAFPFEEAMARTHYEAVVSDYRALASIGFSDFWRRFITVQLELLKRLEQLPRADAFWDNTNGRATLPKLDEFCEEVLKSNPADETALWYSAISDPYGFGGQQWRALCEVGPLEVRWPICAAMYSCMSWPYRDVAPRLARLLRSWGDQNETRALLSGIVSGGGFNTARCAQCALERLDGPLLRGRVRSVRSQRK